MRFLLYNIRYATGGLPGRGPLQFLRPSKQLLDEIVAYIRGVKPDIAGLLEVDSGSLRSRRRHQSRVIAEALGHTHAYRSKYAVNSFAHRIPILRRQGNAIIVRDADRPVRFHYFTNGVKRLVLELEMPDVAVFLVHLALGGRVRLQQMHTLYDLVRSATKPVLLAGDFNAFWGRHEIELFRAACGLRSADPENRPTWPSWRPHRQLDVILHSPDIVVDRFELGNVLLSDHLPLICDFRVPRSRSGAIDILHEAVTASRELY